MMGDNAGDGRERLGLGTWVDVLEQPGRMAMTVVVCNAESHTDCRPL
jgi:hypothetical protein